MPLRHVILNNTYRSAWSRTLELWKPMAVWTLLVWLILTILLVPATSALLHFGFIRGDRLVINNEEILGFLLTPTGLVYLLLVGSLTIIASIVRFSGIYKIVTCKMKHQPITVKELVLETAPSIPRMFRFSVFSIALALLIAVVLLSGIGIIYITFLSGKDINYYLMVQPPEWWHSIYAAGTWMLICGCAFLYIIGRVSVALPAFLDCNITIRKAILSSWKLMGRHSIEFLKMLVFTFLMWIILLMITEALLLSVTLFAVDHLSVLMNKPGTITTIAGSYIIVSQISRSVIGFLGFSFVSVILTKFYHEDSNLKDKAPPAPTFPELRVKLSRQFDRLYTPLRALLLTFILLAAGLGTGAYMAAQVPVADEVKILSHRAGPHPAPENTLAALELAIEQGADIAEIDVMRTADGTLVVFHDRDMMRMTRDPRRIENVEYAEISGLEQFPDGGFPPEERRIATLKEMLLRGKDRIEFMIELKYYAFDPTLAPGVVSIIEETGMENQVSIASPQLGPLLELSEAGVEIPKGYISAFAIGNVARLPVEYIAVQHQQITGSLIKSASENNIEVYAWTVNTPGRSADMINMGVDGIITDYPGMAAEVARNMQEMSLPERFLINITGWQIVKDSVEDKDLTPDD